MTGFRFGCIFCLRQFRILPENHKTYINASDKFYRDWWNKLKILLGHNFSKKLETSGDTCPIPPAWAPVWSHRQLNLGSDGRMASALAFKSKCCRFEQRSRILGLIRPHIRCTTIQLQVPIIRLARILNKSRRIECDGRQFEISAIREFGLG